MSSTRIGNDAFRQQDNNKLSTEIGRYILNTPGNGIDNPYINDINIRLQYWGANIRTDSINIENKLFNVGERLSTHNLTTNNNYLIKKTAEPLIFPINNSNITDNTRMLYPIYTTRDMETVMGDRTYKHHVPTFNDDFIRNQQISTRNQEFISRN
jgi:hypothetical protein